MILEPVTGSKPEVGVGLEFLCHNLQTRIVLLIFAYQEFSLVIETGLLNAVSEPLVNGLYIGSHFFILIQYIVLVEPTYRQS